MTMKDILEIYRYTFRYKLTAVLVIFYNLLFVIFNLVSLILFIPFLQLIFPEEPVASKVLTEPHYNGGFVAFFEYLGKWYNYFMESMVQDSPEKALLFVCISVFLAFFLKNVFRYGAIWYQSELRMAVVRDIREKIFTKAMRLPLAFYTDERKGDLMSRMQSDVGEIEIAVIAVLELFFREPIAILINVALLVYWSPQLTIFSFILLPVSAFVISRIGKSLKRTAGEGQSAMGDLFSTIEESLGGIRIIKAFNAVPFILKTFRANNLRHQKLITKAFRKRDLSPPLNETLGVLVMICIVWYGGSMILDAQGSGTGLSGREFLGFVIVFSQLLRPIQGISTSIGNLNKSQASQRRINEILNMDERIHEAEDALPITRFDEKVVYKNVSFSYRDEPVLRDISFTLHKGQKLALVGESGSGKSTIADLLPRFYNIDSGEISIDGVPVEKLKIDDLRNQIGIVNQESILFNETVANNIAFGLPHVSRDKIVEAAKIANAHKFIEELENGYDTNIGERGNKLSGGQKQRISIARAILRNPSILILDEATSALDTESERLVQDALEKLMADRTTLVIAHRLSTVQNADEIIVLSKGEVKERGNHRELMELKGLYFNLCSLQGIHY